MEINLYAIKDCKMGKFNNPFTAENNDVAKRMLATTMLNKSIENGIYQFAEDYQLFKIGAYDNDTGELKTEVEFVANATEFKKE